MEVGSTRLFFALFLTIWGLGCALNSAYLLRVVHDTVEHPAIQLLFALIPLLIGSYTIATHNIWTFDENLLVTLLGWLIFMGGAFRTLCVTQYVALMKSIKSPTPFRIGGSITAVIGIVLLVFERT